MKKYKMSVLINRDLEEKVIKTENCIQNNKKY